MDEMTPKELFLQSLHRCAKSDNFIPSFYTRFLSSSDEVRQKFRNTDFKHQNQMLLRSLQLVAGATAGEQESLEELRARAETHDRYHLDIKPELYELWRKALIETAREHDNQWNEEIEEAWHSILGHAINHMIKHY
ncbi:MAG: globin [Pirellulales bacterium]|nr:globin [Pirellulales bacterium]